MYIKINNIRYCIILAIAKREERFPLNTLIVLTTPTTHE